MRRSAMSDEEYIEGELRIFVPSTDSVIDRYGSLRNEFSDLPKSLSPHHVMRLNTDKKLMLSNVVEWFETIGFSFDGFEERDGAISSVFWVKWDNIRALEILSDGEFVASGVVSLTEFTSSTEYHSDMEEAAMEGLSELGVYLLSVDVEFELSVHDLEIVGELVS